MRLAFSVSAHLQPEILIVDEVLAVGDAEFQKKCLGKMSDVAGAGRTVLFVSHNMSAILRLTQECVILDHGKMLKRAPSQEAVDWYLSHDYEQGGERLWKPEDIPTSSMPFRPIAMRVKNSQGIVTDSLRSVDPITIEFEYQLEAPVIGLRVGFYLNTSRGEFVFTSFDTDEPDKYARYTDRKPGHYISRCVLPGDLLNEGRFVLGVNAGSYRVRRYFQEENAILFNVNPTGAPGMQWPESRQGVIRPRLNWTIEEI
jgi:lipopolysaccharide transport system ATP-binding protein